MLLPATAWGEKDGTVTNSERRISRQRRFLPAPGDARPDWWIGTQVAHRMGFAAAFPYASAADIFREHASLSAFENAGTRDFDLSGLAALSDGAYDTLDPVQWPVVDHVADERRFFADGRFFTAERRAHFIAPEKPQHSVAAGRDYPFRLNTGRVRDQWHTMTRTTLSARLATHLPLPFVEVNPADAAAAGVVDGDFARPAVMAAAC